MTKLDETFDTMFDELILAIEKQRELHTSAFGKENAQTIISEAENNRKKLDCWWGLLQELKSEMIESGLFHTAAKKPPKRRQTPTKPNSNSKGITTNTKPVSVTVLGRRFIVNHWKDVLLFVCKTLYEKKPYLFDNLDSEGVFQGRKRPYLSRDKNTLFKPAKIEGSDLYVETNFSANSIVQMCNTLLIFCEYTSTDMVIEERVKV